ncbi:MAG: PIN domain-containing protein [Chromatiales bacterium]|nr:PIN domain-containing protein [Chromatiales bacterium]
MRNIVLVDSRFLIALFDAKDSLHDSAKAALKTLVDHEQARLKTVWPVVVETCFLLGPNGKTAFLRWIARGALGLRAIEASDIEAVIAILNRYADQRIDLADACLIWLAGQEKTNRVLTTDRRDFSVYRAPDGKPFERVWLANGA